MLCEKYKPALIEAAITGADLQPAVREHLESCVHCAAELAQQRSLVSAIDTNLRLQMNAPVPAAMLHRFEARLAQQTPRRSFSLTWLYAAAAFATAVAMIFFALSHPRTHKPNAETALVQTTQSIPEHSPQIVPLVLRPATEEEMERDRKQHSHRAARSGPEVLVPADERIAFEHYLAGLRGQPGLVVAVVNRAPQDVSVTPLDMADIQTASLIVAPIRESAAVSDK